MRQKETKGKAEGGLGQVGEAAQAGMAERVSEVKQRAAELAGEWGGAGFEGWAGKVVGSVSGLEAWRAVLETREWEGSCDWVELRLDMLAGLVRVGGVDNAVLAEVEAGWQREVEAGMQVLVTPRHPSEGGQNPEFADAATRRELVERVLAGAGKMAVLDWELARWEELAAEGLAERLKEAGVKLVASAHRFEGAFGEAEIAAMILRAAEAGADIAKFAWKIETLEDLWVGCRILEKEWPVKVALMGMGELGAASRVIYGWMGSELVYGYLGGESTAPGQLASREFREILGSD